MGVTLTSFGGGGRAALLVFSSSPLTAGTVGTPYAEAFVASGGSPGYTWAITAGSLPAGLSLSAAGVISGTPTATGTSNFTVQVTDSAGRTASKAFALTINALVFTENFNQPNNSAGFGSNQWMTEMDGLVVNKYEYFRILNNQLQTVRLGAGATGSGAHARPRLLVNALWGIAQYAQCQFIGRTGDARAGVTVMASFGLSTSNIGAGNNPAFNGYFLMIGVGGFRLQRYTIAAPTLGAGPYAAVAGDVIRLEVTPAAGQNNLVVKVNAAIIDTVADANAARPVFEGSPGFWNQFISLVATDESRWESYEAGSL